MNKEVKEILTIVFIMLLVLFSGMMVGSVVGKKTLRAKLEKEGGDNVPKITKVGVSYGLTVQPAPYESIRTDLSVELEIDEWDDPSEILEATRITLKNRVTKAIEADVAAWKKKG